jgi:hypothetical protein
MLLDSNIIIYAARPDARQLQDYIESRDVFVSAISYVEVLGFPRLHDTERRWFKDFFEKVDLIPVARPVLDEAVRLRQQRSVKLGDALIAATALVHDLELVTHNFADFSWITGLRVVDPMAP